MTTFNAAVQYISTHITGDAVLAAEELCLSIADLLELLTDTVAEIEELELVGETADSMLDQVMAALKFKADHFMTEDDCFAIMAYAYTV